MVMDPYAKAIPDKELTEVQIRKREEDWYIVEKYILHNMSELLNKQGRENKIQEIVKDSGLGKTKVKSFSVVIGAWYEQKCDVT